MIIMLMRFVATVTILCMTATRRKGTLSLLSRLSKRTMRAAPESRLGISFRHYMALSAIPELISQRELAEMLCIDANNTVLLLNELEALGWVRRERDPLDRRRHVVHITPAGHEKVRHAQEVRDEVEDDVLGPLSPAERQALHDLVAKALGEDAD